MMKTLSLVAAALLLAACGKTAAPAATTPKAGAGTAATAAVAAAASLDQPAEATPPATASDMYAAQLATVLAGPRRSAADKARDRYRHPRATLDFFGVKPDQTVIEITPGGGWYANVLAPWIEGSGQYVAAIAKSAKPDSEASRGAAALQGLIKTHPAQFGHARIVRFDPAAPVFGAPASADRVLTFRNAHNWVAAGTAAAMFKGFYDVLKPGGVLGVVDHRAGADDDLAAVKGTGYLPVDYVVGLATAAGFKLAAKSEINANPKDNHHHPKGVWTLPPTYALGATDHAKYAAIGESDRMTLRFVKPKSDEIHTAGMESSAAPAASASTR